SLALDRAAHGAVERVVAPRQHATEQRLHARGYLGLDGDAQLSLESLLKVGVDSGDSSVGRDRAVRRVGVATEDELTPVLNLLGQFGEERCLIAARVWGLVGRCRSGAAAGEEQAGDTY